MQSRISHVSLNRLRKRKRLLVFIRGYVNYVKKMNVTLSKEQRLYQHTNVFVVMDCPANKEQIKIID